jgi:signal transduction histidine kinase
MRPIRLFFSRMPPKADAVTREAAREVFPEAEIVEVAGVDEAARWEETSHPELLVLALPDPATAAQAVQATDAVGLPRWAVVILGRGPGDLADTVPPEQWNAALLGRTFRSAVLQHELLRENLRLQGDLRTVAKRIRHDLFSPVGCICTSSQVLKIVLPAGTTPSIAVMVRNIEDSSAEISQIIDRVSFVLRASADPALPSEVDMGEVVADVLAQLEREIKQTEATIALPPAWPAVSGVASWLQMIWWNLLHNALKHGGPKPAVRVAWSAQEGGHRLSVIDEGPGIAEESRPTLFRPFDQLHLRPSPGLGLSIVHRLTTLQGGHCGYERTANGKAEFFFTLPDAPARRRSANASPASELAEKKKSATVVPLRAAG